MIAISVLLAIVLLLLIPKDNNKKIVLSGYNNQDTLDLGEYKVTNYKKEESYYGEYNRITFEVEDSNDFYNNVIKKNQYYNENLDFDNDRYFVYGYMIINNSLFNYSITNDNIVTIMSNYFYYSGISSYFTYVFAPTYGYISYETIEDDLVELNNSDRKYNMYFYNGISFENLCSIYSYLSSDLCKIEDDIIYVKGILFHYISKERHISDDYLIKIYFLDGYIMVGNVDE